MPHDRPFLQSYRVLFCTAGEDRVLGEYFLTGPPNCGGASRFRLKGTLWAFDRSEFDPDRMTLTIWLTPVAV